MTPALSDAQREAVKKRINEQTVARDEIDEVIEVIKQEVFQWRVEQLTRNILDRLEERGVNTSRANVDVPQIAAETAVNQLIGADDGPEMVEIPVAGRTNQGTSEWVNLDTNSDGPETYTVEVPIEAGEDPNTIEVERVDPGTDPRLNSDLSPMERHRAFEEGLPPEMLRRKGRTNDSGASGGETDPEDVPATGRRVNERETDDSGQDDDDTENGGLPWYQ